MEEACLFDIMELSEGDLKKVLPKISVRSLVRLLAAYPRTVARPFMALLSESLSPAAMEFLLEERTKHTLPSFPQIRSAESELIKVIEEEKLFPEPVHA